MKSLHSYLQQSSYSRCGILSDPTIFSLYGKQLCAEIDAYLPTCSILLPTGEEAKTWLSALHCWEKMYAYGLDRKSVLLCLGGGTISDVGGFAAGCYMRGIDVIHIPTTLMAMVDAAIGGKTGINLPEGKNLIGVFHQPKLVVTSLHFLATLTESELRSGLAEVIKYGVIRDPDLFQFLEGHMPEILKKEPLKLQHIIANSQHLKNEIVQLDEKEKGLRAILNYGHTFAHALEAVTGYAKYSHGEAVSIGMSCAAWVSHALGIVEEDFISRQEQLCLRAGLPTSLPESLDLNLFINKLKYDKKAVGKKINLILAKRVGEVEKVDDVDPMLIRTALMKKIEKD